MSKQLIKKKWGKSDSQCPTTREATHLESDIDTGTSGWNQFYFIDTLDSCLVQGKIAFTWNTVSRQGCREKEPPFFA